MGQKSEGSNEEFNGSGEVGKITRYRTTNNITENKNFGSVLVVPPRDNPPRGGTKNAYTENQSNVKCFYGRKLLIKNLKNSVNIVDDLNNQFIIFKNLTFIFNEVMLWIKHSTVKIDFGERSLTLVYAFLVPPRAHLLLANCM